MIYIVIWNIILTALVIYLLRKKEKTPDSKVYVYEVGERRY